MVVKVGILGGTFDPIHLGHLLMAKEAMVQCDLDKVLFVPNRQSPLKKKAPRVTNFHRLNMLELATDEIAGFEVSDFEIRKKGPSYTVETVKHFKEKSIQNTQLYFILGEDSFLSIDKWKNPSLLLSLLSFCVFRRLLSEKNAGKLLSVAALNQLMIPIMNEKKKMKTTIFAPVSNISSSQVRQFTEQRKSISVLVPRAVEEYILRHQLYHNEEQP